MTLTEIPTISYIHIHEGVKSDLIHAHYFNIEIPSDFFFFIQSKDGVSILYHANEYYPCDPGTFFIVAVKANVSVHDSSEGKIGKNEQVQKHLDELPPKKQKKEVEPYLFESENQMTMKKEEPFLFQEGDIASFMGAKGIMSEYDPPEKDSISWCDEDICENFTRDGRHYPWHTLPSLTLIERPKKKVPKTFYFVCESESLLDTFRIVARSRMYSSKECSEYKDTLINALALDMNAVECETTIVVEE